MLKRRVPLIVIVVLVAVVALLLATTVFADYGTVKRRVTVMNGAAEVPGPGDPDGRGSATIWLNAQRRSVCWKLVARKIDPATAAHIHVGAAGVAGPVVVGLTAPTDGESRGCAYDVDRELIRNIIMHPRQYYVNVHNAPYPAGAIRGQLMGGGQ